VYIACMHTIITYASPVWWTGKKSHTNMLTHVQNSSLWHICAAFRTTTIHALKVGCTIPPIHLHLDLLNSCFATSIHTLSRYSPVLQCLPQEWHGFFIAFPSPPPMTTQ
ncbi:hypothetical protein V8B97DRAFT_1849286, partial [Scleroderma yunnanense]